MTVSFRLPLSTLRRVLFAVLATPTVACFATFGSAQCTPSWVLGPDPQPGTTSGINTMIRHPLGGVVAGSDRVERWDGRRWTGLGTTTGSVRALAFLPSGELIVGGNFTAINGVPASKLARWDGTTWSALGALASNTDVYALAVTATGKLVVGGVFSTIGGVAANSIAQWDGTNWSALGTGAVANTVVRGIAALPNGNVVAIGNFSTLGSVARWNGSTWSGLGSGPNLAPDSLAVLANGDVVIGGPFTAAGGVGASRIARWNGTQWSALGTGVGGGAPTTVTALLAMSNGDLLAGGNFTIAGGQAANSIARWNGTAWSRLDVGLTGGSPTTVWSMVEPISGHVLTSGYFNFAGTAFVSHLAEWDGSTWGHLGRWLDGAVKAIAPRPQGDVVVGGQFSSAGDVPGASGVALWDGSSFRALGSGVEVGGWVNAVQLRANGDIVVGGGFSTIGGIPSAGIARWDGTAWHDLGALGAQVLALCEMPNGDIIAGGPFSGGPANYLARWDGLTWSPLGTGPSYHVKALALDATGMLIAGGSFLQAGGVSASHIARWNGTSWSALGTGLRGSPVNGITTWVNDIVLMPNGDLVACGLFNLAGSVSASHIARWNGTAWSALGSGLAGEAMAMQLLPNGDLVVTGLFTSAGGVPNTQGVARWNGTNWSAMGATVVQGDAAALTAAGALLVGGLGFTANGTTGSYMASFGCPGEYTVFGPGCPGTAGIPGNVARSTPRLGSTLVVDFPRVPIAAFVFFGFSNTMSGPTLLPYDTGALGAPGCAVRSSPDFLPGLLLGVDPTWNMLLPLAPVLLGVPLFTQAASLDPVNPLGLVFSDAARMVLGN